MLKLLPIKKSFTRFFLFSLIYSSLITPAIANDKYWFGFSWGGMSGACTAYKFDMMTQKNAQNMVKRFLVLGKQKIKDRNTYLELKNLQRKGPFNDDCWTLISD